VGRVPFVVNHKLRAGSSESPAGLDQARVFVTDSQSWSIAGQSGGGGGAFAGTMAGGARPQTAEIIKTFGQRCPQVIINNIQTKTDYIVLLDHEGGKGALRHKNKVAGSPVFPVIPSSANLLFRWADRFKTRVMRSQRIGPMG
jgi:hypothetical protein